MREGFVCRRLIARAVQHQVQKRAAQLAGQAEVGSEIVGCQAAGAKFDVDSLVVSDPDQLIEFGFRQSDQRQIVAELGHTQSQATRVGQQVDGAQRPLREMSRTPTAQV